MSAPPLGKHLASSDKKTRDKAMKALKDFICDEKNASLPPLDRAKLWKGIFYCFYMSDKPLVQQALATDLANILLSIPSQDTALTFLRDFWETMIREWTGLDKYRLDKYYMLIRKYINASFRLLIRADWDASVCESYNDILSGPGGPLYHNDIKIPVSLSYHLSDIYLDELNKVLASLPDDVPPSPLPSIILPFITLTSLTQSNITVKRMTESLLEPLIAALQTASAPPQITSEEEEPTRKRLRLDEKGASASAKASPSTAHQGLSKDTPLWHVVHRSTTAPPSSPPPSTIQSPSPPQEVRKAVLKTIFDVASKEETRDANRRKMYALWKAAKSELDEDEDGDEAF